MSSQDYSEWHVYDADGVKRPAVLPVQLGSWRQAEVNRLLEEYRSQAGASDLEPGDVVAWLCERGVPDEIVPIVLGAF